MKPLTFLIIVLIFISLLFVVLPNLLGYSSSGTFFQLVRAGVFRSYDGGKTWFEKSYINESRKIKNVNILDIAFDPSDSNIVYLGTKGNGLFKSYNAGDNWNKVLDNNNVLNLRADIYKIAVNSKNSKIIYLAGYQNNFGVVLKSIDGGKSFNRVFISSIKRSPVLDIKINPISPNILYIATADGGLFKSSDYGKSWEAIKWFFDRIQSIAINQYNPFQIYVALANSGIFRSDDGGITWKDLNSDLAAFSEAKKTIMILIDNHFPNIIYLASYFGLFKSINYGRNWKLVRLIVPPKVLPISYIAQDPKNYNVIYVGAGSNIYKSKDAGESWVVKKINTNKKINVIKIDPLNSLNIYLGIHE